MKYCNLFLLVLLAWLMLMACGCQYSSDYLHQEEETAVTISHTVIKGAWQQPIRWKLTLFDAERPTRSVARCNFSSQCTDFYPTEFHSSLEQAENSYDEDFEVYNASLIVMSPNRTMRTLELTSSSSQCFLMYLDIFKKPVSVTCSTPQVEDDFLKIVCITAGEAYPLPLCSINFEPSSPAFSYTITYDRSDPVASKCTWIGRPSASKEHILRGYLFQAEVTPSRGFYCLTSSWSSPFTVYIVDFTANNERTNLTVDYGGDVTLSCSLRNAGDLHDYTLQISDEFGKVLISQTANLLRYTLKILDFSTNFSCQVMDIDEASILILGDNVTVHVTDSKGWTPSNESASLEQAKVLIGILISVLLVITVLIFIMCWRTKCMRRCRELREAPEYPSIVALAQTNISTRGDHSASWLDTLGGFPTRIGNYVQSQRISRSSERRRAQHNPPLPSYEQTVLNDSLGLGALSAQDLQFTVPPPSYDTVCKPEEAPLPYPGTETVF